MAKRMMLIPPELYGGYQQQQQRGPEIRLQEDISTLLDREQLADDAKAKILGHLITRYQKVTHEPPEPIRVNVVNDRVGEYPRRSDIREEEEEEEEEETPADEKDAIVRDILQSVPKTHAKFIPPILEKLKTRLYTWNDRGEFVDNDVPIQKSKIADFFSYMMRTSKKAVEPVNFKKFLYAIKEINIPISWIPNPKVIKLLQSNRLVKEISSDEEENFPTNQRTSRKTKRRSVSAGEPISPDESWTPKPWKTY